jgi:diacylglycerol kinase family enzyme
MESTNLCLPELKFGAIINTSSGGCDSESEAEIVDILKAAGVNKCTTWCGKADQVEQSFTEAATQEIQVLVVLGGDGTIRTAAEACNAHGTHLLPLPGGTMNMLPRALYGDAPWQDTLQDTLAHPVTRVLSGGRAADNLFFVSAIVGAAALWVEARESVREGDVVDVIEKGAIAFQNMFDTKIQYFISPENTGEAEILTVICPLISQEMSDSEQALEAAVINVENGAQLIGLATVAAFGKWREDENVVLSKTKRVVLQSGKDIPLFLDGERVKTGNNAEISFVPEAAKIIVSGQRLVNERGSRPSL